MFARVIGSAMRTLLFRCALAIPLLLLALPVHGGEDTVNPISQRATAWFSNDDTRTITRINTALYQSNFTPTFFRLSDSGGRLRDLASETDRPRTQGVLASTAWLKGMFTTETEVANNYGGNSWLQGKIPGDTRDDPSTRMMRLGLSATAGAVRYGVTYRNAGQAFYNAPDQAVREAWSEWQHGWTTIRSAIGHQWNNVAADPMRSRMEQTYRRIGLTWTRPFGPILTLTYGQNSMNSALDPIGIAPQRLNNHTMEAAVAYNSAQWHARLASSYIVGTDQFRNGAESNVKMQMLTASFRPLNTLTIAPSVSYRAEQQDWSGVRIDSPSASLALHYRQSQRLLISALGNYGGTHSSDGLIDTGNFGGKGVFAWDLQQSCDWLTLLSLEAGYNRLTNRVTPSAETEDISGLVRLVLATL